ncbi:MAG: sulfotransferase family protein [Desulfobulbaceae bacterium]
MIIKASAKRKAQQISHQRAVFIIGEARSGTSILYRSLQQHREFKVRAATLGEDLTESNVFQNPLAVLKAAACMERNAASAYMLHNNERLTSLKSYLRCSLIVRPLDITVRRRPMISSIFHSTMALRLLGIHHLLRLFFEEARIARCQGIILDKSPSSINNVPLISVAFPNAKLLYIHRHPVATLASYRKRYKRETAAGRDPALFNWAKVTVEGLATRLARSIKTVASIEKSYGLRTFMVRYESLVNTPETVLDGVVDFLEIEGGGHLWFQHG